MNFYQAGYYLIQIDKTINEGVKPRKLMTASGDFNGSLLDSWSLSWGSSGWDLSKVSQLFGLEKHRSLNSFADLGRWEV